MVVRALAAGAGLALLASASGCGPSCQPSEIVWTHGQTSSNGVVVSYESTPPEGPFAPFNGGAIVRFPHRMGVRPLHVDVFLSFNENPPQQRGAGSAPAAGNQALLVEQTEDFIAIENNSCANYFIRVVASAPAPGQDASLDDATDATDVGDGAASDAATDSADSD